MSTNLADVPANCLFVDRVNNNFYYLGTDLGIMYSPDAGVSWQSIDAYGLANVPVMDVAYQASTNTLIAFTFGRGVYTVVPERK